ALSTAISIPAEALPADANAATAATVNIRFILFLRSKNCPAAQTGLLSNPQNIRRRRGTQPLIGDPGRRDRRWPLSDGAATADHGEAAEREHAEAGGRRDDLAADLPAGELLGVEVEVEVAGEELGLEGADRHIVELQADALAGGLPVAQRHE